MSNHGHEGDPFFKIGNDATTIFEKRLGSLQKEIKRITEEERLGSTGRFPLGKIIPEDEGELRFSIAADPQTKTIILNFGTPVTWFAMPRSDAQALIATIQEKLKEIE